MQNNILNMFAFLLYIILIKLNYILFSVINIVYKNIYCVYLLCIYKDTHIVYILLNLHVYIYQGCKLVRSEKGDKLIFTCLENAYLRIFRYIWTRNKTKTLSRKAFFCSAPFKDKHLYMIKRRLSDSYGLQSTRIVVKMLHELSQGK